MVVSARLLGVALLAAVVLGGCAAPTSQPATAGQAAPPGAQRTLVIVTRAEPATVADRGLRLTGGRSTGGVVRPWNAALTTQTERQSTVPYLAEALPELNSDTWKVFPDGRMETIYRLRPNIVWHDGTLLSAQDFVFAWGVYQVPDFGYARSNPNVLIDQVTAPDERSVIIQWKSPYAEAGQLSSGFPPLPRQILEEPLRSLSPDGFVAHSYWGGDFVGLGPYKLMRWEPGAFMEGIAFDQHVLGRPKIDQIRVLFMPDPTVVVASMLSDAGHMAVDESIRFEQGHTLQNQWTSGKVLFSPTQVRWAQVQLKPETANPKAFLDLRFRKALAHAFEKQAFVDGLLQGLGTPADTIMTYQVAFYDRIEKIITKYPYDLRRTEQFMAEVGYTKGPDGVYAHPTEGKLDIEIWSPQGTQNEAEITILADSLRKAGIPGRPFAIPAARAQDAEYRASFPGLSPNSNINGFEPPLGYLRVASIPTPENRFRGSNRNGYVSPAFERAAAAYDVTLDRTERENLTVEMMRIVSEELPGIPMYFNYGVIAHRVDLEGPLAGGSGWNWNMHEWRWK